MNRIVKTFFRIAVVTLCFTCMFCRTVSAQQQKALTFEEITQKAVEAKIITSEERNKMMEIEQKFAPERKAVKEKNLSDEELKAAMKPINDEVTKEFKELLGKERLAEWLKFRRELNEKQ